MSTICFIETVDRLDLCVYSLHYEVVFEITMVYVSGFEPVTFDGHIFTLEDSALTLQECYIQLVTVHI